MFQESVKVPKSKSTINRFKNMGENDYKSQESNSGSGFKRIMANLNNNNNTVFPTNVLHLSSESTNKNHPATFPDKFAEFFIKLFTRENNTVLDPFAGSGTTMKVAHRLNRSSIGIEIKEKYCEMITNYFIECDKEFINENIT